jgi:predicted homoserine dehydrogenase-like protein
VIVDRALEERADSGRPIRVGIVGAGFMARAVAQQILRHVPGIRVVAIANRHLERAREAWSAAGVDEVSVAEDQAAFDRHAAAGRRIVAEDPGLLCDSDAIDLIFESTGAVEFGAHVVARALEQGRHVVLNNAELDATVGPVLQRMARSAGRVLTGIDGDQPAVQMNLYRFVRSMGLQPVVCGNIKGLHDPYRTPLTQAEFARTWGQDPQRVTGFADGSKVSFEQAMIGNAVGFGIAPPDLLGSAFDGHVDELVSHYDPDRLRELGGIIDWVVGARPAPGVYVLALVDDPSEQTYLRLYKMGPGPLYVFYVPYHLCHYEVPLTIGRAALFGDAAISARTSSIEVVARAKTDLTAGTVIDGIGGFMTYGDCQNAAPVAAGGLLPMGVAEGCRLVRDVARDQILRYADVLLPPDRLVDRLREQLIAPAAPAGVMEPPLSRV